MGSRSHSPTPSARSPRRPRSGAVGHCGHPAPSATATLEALLTDWLTRFALATVPARRDPGSEVDYCGCVEHVLHTEEEARLLAARQLERLYARLRWFADTADDLPPVGSGSTNLPPSGMPRAPGARGWARPTSAARASPSRR